MTVEDVLKAIEKMPSLKPLRDQLERFSLGTPIKGATGDPTFFVTTLKPTTKATMGTNEVILE